MKDMLLKCCLKFKSARITRRVTQIRMVFLHPYPFCELFSAFNGISQYKLSDYLVTCSWQRSKQITDVIRDKGFKKDYSLL